MPISSLSSQRNLNRMLLKTTELRRKRFSLFPQLCTDWEKNCFISTTKFIPETSLKMTNSLDVTENTNETTSTSLFGKPTNIQLKFRPPEFKTVRGTFNNLNCLHSLFFIIEPFHYK